MIVESFNRMYYYTYFALCIYSVIGAVISFITLSVLMSYKPSGEEETSTEFESMQESLSSSPKALLYAFVFIMLGYPAIIKDCITKGKKIK